MRPPVIISSHSGRIATIVIAVVSLLVIGWDVATVGLAGGMRDLPLACLFVWITWLMWGMASVTLDDRGVRVVNQLRIWEVPWASLEEATGRWGLSLVTTHPRGTGSRTIRAWAAPARGSVGRIARPAPEMPVVSGTEPVRTSLDAGQAARLIEIEQEQRRTEPRSTGNDNCGSRDVEHPGPGVVVRPNWATIVVTVVLVAALLLT